MTEQMDLFGEWQEVPRPKPHQPGTYSYSGPRTTCFVCTRLVARGEPLDVPRGSATWKIILPSGRTWLVCGHHRSEHERGALDLAEGG